jgi:hypothetical protein
MIFPAFFRQHRLQIQMPAGLNNPQSGNIAPCGVSCPEKPYLCSNALMRENRFKSLECAQAAWQTHG